MDKLIIFVAIAVSISLATEQLKQSIAQLTHFKITIFIAQLLGLFGVISLGSGLIESLGFSYPNEYFRYFDMATTGLIVSAGGGIIRDWYEKIMEASINNKN